MFEIIDTPFPPVKTVRLDNRGDFRPCSTGLDIDNLKMRTIMEKKEIEYTNDRKIVASAAHIDKEIALENAWQEAIERISLAAWWALNRSFRTKFSDDAVKKIVCNHKIEIPESFSLRVGLVESVNPDYKVACSIISSERNYPFAVLGGGCSKNAMQAAEKAIYESMQSWTATNWIDSHQNTESKVYWDTKELIHRIAELSSLTVEESHIQTPPKADCLGDLGARVTFCDNVYVAEIIESHGISHVTSELARVAMRDDEHISVFTHHNL